MSPLAVALPQPLTAAPAAPPKAAVPPQPRADCLWQGTSCDGQQRQQGLGRAAGHCFGHCLLQRLPSRTGCPWCCVAERALQQQLQQPTQLVACRVRQLLCMASPTVTAPGLLQLSWLLGHCCWLSLPVVWLPLPHCTCGKCGRIQVKVVIALQAAEQPKKHATWCTEPHPWQGPTPTLWCGAAPGPPPQKTPKEDRNYKQGGKTGGIWKSPAVTQLFKDVVTHLHRRRHLSPQTQSPSCRRCHQLCVPRPRSPVVQAPP
jgi:hypothetical protein